MSMNYDYGFIMQKGVCIGLDMEKTIKYLSRMMGLIIGCQEWEVQYIKI